MPEKVKDVQPPTGLGRLLLRLPLALYQMGLGRLLGRRFLQLAHTGRKTGQLRHTVLEVVRYDPQTGEYIVAAGFGPRSDWYRNIKVHPRVEVRSAGDCIQAQAVELSPEQAGEALLDYAHRYPLAFRELVRFMGYRVDGSDADTRVLGKYLHLIALRPLST